MKDHLNDLLLSFFIYVLQINIEWRVYYEIKIVKSSATESKSKSSAHHRIKSYNQ